MVGWSGVRSALGRLAGAFRRRGLSGEAIGILLEAGLVEVYQPSQGDTVFTRRGTIHEAIEVQTYASRPRLAITSKGQKYASSLSP